MGLGKDTVLYHCSDPICRADASELERQEPLQVGQDHKGLNNANHPQQDSKVRVHFRVLLGESGIYRRSLLGEAGIYRRSLLSKASRHIVLGH